MIEDPAPTEQTEDPAETAPELDWRECPICHKTAINGFCAHCGFTLKPV